MIAGNSFRPSQIGDGARDFQDAVVSPGAQVQVGHRKFEEFHGRFVQSTMLFQFPGAHAGVAGDLGLGSKPLLLLLSRRHHALADLP